MITISLHDNNRLIRKTIVRMFPSSFAANLTVSVALMVDTLLAGALLGQQAIAAVAIGTPAIGIFQALTQTVVSGAAVKMTISAGRSDTQKMNRACALGISATALLGLVFISVCLLLADRLAMAFGGAGNPAVAAQAALYLRAGSVCILMGSLNTFLGKILTLFGYQKDVLRAALIAMTGNIIFSILYIWLLPDHLAIMGLSAGTWTGGGLACLSSFLAIRAHKIPLRPRLRDVDVKEIPEIFRLGFPTSGNNLADGVVSGVVNNIIVMGFGGDTTALSVYTAVKGVMSFAVTAVLGATTSTGSLFGILYGARDKNGFLRTFREGIRMGLVATVAWCGVILAALPLLARFYGMTGNPEFRGGVLLCLLFIPLCLVTRLLVQVFETTGKTAMGLLYSIVPDSVIYPLLLAALLPVLGYDGIWLAYNANVLPFGLVLYLVRSVKAGTLRMSWERLLCLDETIRDNVPMLDISISSSNTDVTGISRQVHEFLSGQEVSARTAYMTALCLEELAADFVAHTLQEGKQDAERVIMDIKLFSDEDRLRVVIRNEAAAYNPLDFSLDDTTFAKVGVKLAQKVARRIEYSYVYKLNIVTIDVDK